MKHLISKQRITHEAGEFLVVFLMVGPFVVALASYRLFLRPSDSAVFAYGTAVVNAFVLAKIILTLGVAGLGKSSENRPLVVATLHKALVATVLYLAFQGMETTVHGVVHGQSLPAALGAGFVTEKGELLMRGLVTFFAGIPFFALHEVRRVMGADTFRRIFFGRGRPKHFEASAGAGKDLQSAL